MTHSINFLPETDLIVCMKSGTIAECDSYDRLMSKEDGEFRNFITNFSNNSNDDDGAVESSNLIGDAGHVDHAFKSSQGCIALRR